MFSFLGSPFGRQRAASSSSSSSSSRHARSNSLAHDGSPLPSPPISFSSTESLAKQWPEFIFEESQLLPAVPLPAHLADLNNSLEVLVAIFPDVQVEVFREMLSSFSEESRLALVTDLLLKNPGPYVKGRRIALSAGNGDAPAPTTTTSHNINKPQTAATPDKKTALLPRNEVFRDDAYKDAVRALATQEFMGLSKSAIQAVLSEYNYSYLDARPTLVSLSSKSWKFAISSLFYRRKPVTSKEAKKHPLIVWKSSGHGSIVPSIKSTNHAELDRELYYELIAPLRKQEQGKREADDRALAVTLNTEEAEAYGAIYECSCCFTESTFEEFTTCNTEGHMVCFQCVQHSINEAIFGQGWQRSINKEIGTLRCPAVSAQECRGHICSDDIFRAVSQQKNGAEIMHKFDQRLADHDLMASGMDLIRCPFCSYAEVDDIYVPFGADRLRFRSSNLHNVIFLLVLPLLLFPLCVIVPVTLLLLALPIISGSVRHYIGRQLRGAVSRFRRRRRGLKFKCQNPACGRESCMSCSKAWVDIHVCHESSLVALRVQVEQAMAMAVKRVCPRCNTSFVKNGGCNKLTCPCGYKMCYVCRKDISGAAEGYQHFCQHFRPEGDGRDCGKCNKCNLWEQEDTNAILREAKMEAERKWRQTEKRELSDAEKAYLHDATRSGAAADSSPLSLPYPWSSSSTPLLAMLQSPSAVFDFLFPGLMRVTSVEDLVDLGFEAVFI